METNNETWIVSQTMYLNILEDDGLAWQALNGRSVEVDHHLTDTISFFICDDE